MDIYEYDDYRQALKDVVEARKKSGFDITFQTLAEHMDVPKSYVSKVMGQGAHFSADQLFQACQALHLDEHQQRYMMLLLEFQRSAVTLRKQILKQELDNIRHQQLDTNVHIAATPAAASINDHFEYFLDPHNQLIHMALTIPEIAINASMLSRRLNMSEHIVSRSLGTLKAANLIQQKGQQITVTKDSLHLQPDAPVYLAWRHQLRCMSLAKMYELPKEKSYSFSAVFTGDDSTKIKIRKEFLKFIALAEDMANKCPKEQLYQLNFDLHDWL